MAKISRFNRPYDKKEPYRKIYIFCEWEKTEVFYFEAKKKEIMDNLEVKRDQIKIYIEWTWYNTKSLVNYTIKQKEEWVSWDDNNNRDEYRVVFDKDSFKGGAFNDAVQLAKNNWINVARSNECFELWYLLHFCYFNTWTDRKTYFKKLTSELKNIMWKNAKYEKNTTVMHSLIIKNEKQAIKRAKQLVDENDHLWENWAKMKPMTMVFLLVEELNKLTKG
jgi:hypothetical protein